MGTLRPLWSLLFASSLPFALKFVNQLATCAIVGVTTGMVGLGILIDTRLGRRQGGIVTSGLMTLGALGMLLTTMFLIPSSMTLEIEEEEEEEELARLFQSLSAWIFIFSIGVGGEYPVSACSASERVMVMSSSSVASLSSKSHHQQYDGDSSNNNDCNGKYIRNSNGNNNSSSKNKNSNRGGGREEPLLSNDDDENDDDDGNNNKYGSDNVSPPAPTSQHGMTNTIIHNHSNNNNGNDTNITKHETRRRGWEVLTVFSMQGLGIFIQSLMLVLLLLVTRKPISSSTVNDIDNSNDDVVVNNDKKNDDVSVIMDGNNYYYTRTSLLNIWRLTYGVGMTALLIVFIGRVLYLKESRAWIKMNRQRQQLQHQRRRLNKEEVEEKTKTRRQQQQQQQKTWVKWNGLIMCIPESCSFIYPPELTERNEQKKMEGMVDATTSTKYNNEEIQQRQTFQQQPQPEKETIVSQPTMSSLTMRYEFDLLGPANIVSGCKVIPVTASCLHPVVVVNDNINNSNNEEEDDEEEEHCNNNNNNHSFSLLLRNYGVRLFGTCSTWLLWDVAYYGNKLFQSNFIIALMGVDGTLVDIAGGEFCNCCFSLETLFVLCENTYPNQLL